MSLNETVSAERIHIGFFGLRNAGKSSLVNAVTGQSLSLVSDVKGTTTDPVKKAMELLPLGPVVIIDTPGLDDTGELGAQRVQRARQMLDISDIAVLVVDSSIGLSEYDNELLTVFKNKGLPYIIAYNKSDLLNEVPDSTENEIYVSSTESSNISEFKDKIASKIKTAKIERRLLAEIVKRNDTVLLVIPIDESAPKGRLILPQQQTIRELLDIGASIVISQVSELADTISKLKKSPDLVITDSQVFGEVSNILSDDVPLTSFSIIFARYKGDLAVSVKGASQLDKLREGDKVLISEGCTHHRQCKDIGTVKLPGWIKEYTGKDLEFNFTSGGEFPDNLSEYSLVVHCGACMLNEKEVKSRYARCANSATPITNYGIAIAQMHGILKRSIMPFPDLTSLLD